MNNEMIISKPYARIKEVKDLPKPNENCLRIYQTQNGCGVQPDVFAFQIRTHGPIRDTISTKHGKPRDMIATVQLSSHEIVDIANQIKNWKVD